MKTNKWVVLMIFWLVWGVIFADRFLITYVSPLLVKQFHINMAQFGMLMSATTLTWLIMNAIGGGLGDHFGHKKVLIPAMLFYSATTWLTAVVRSFNPLLLIRGLVGLGEGCYWGNGITMINNAWPEEKRGFALGFHQTASPIIGVFVAGTVAGVVAQRWGWQAPFWCFAIAGLILTIVVWAFIRVKNEKKTHQEAAAEGAHRSFKSDLQTLVSTKGWLLNLATTFFVMMSYMSIFAFLPLYLSSVRGMSVAAAASITGLTGLGGFLGELFTGTYSDYIGRRVAIVISALLVLISIPIVLYSKSTPMLIFGVLLLGYAINSPYPICIAVIPAEVSPPALIATGVGISAFLGEIGAFVAPIVGGMLNDHYGLYGSFWLAFCAAIAFGLLALVMKETAPKYAKNNVSSVQAEL